MKTSGCYIQVNFYCTIFVLSCAGIFCREHLTCEPDMFFCKKTALILSFSFSWFKTAPMSSVENMLTQSRKYATDNIKMAHPPSAPKKLFYEWKVNGNICVDNVNAEHVENREVKGFVYRYGSTRVRFLTVNKLQVKTSPPMRQKQSEFMPSELWETLHCWVLQGNHSKENLFLSSLWQHSASQSTELRYRVSIPIISPCVIHNCCIILHFCAPNHQLISFVFSYHGALVACLLSGCYIVWVCNFWMCHSLEKNRTPWLLR